ncbi:Argininosuccinate lyase [Fusarium oxysporum f. sp. albedinis]|nr:Argininosuccinate lyase [Fusarium oxysporum f. sp. albedinis]
MTNAVLDQKDCHAPAATSNALLADEIGNLQITPRHKESIFSELPDNQASIDVMETNPWYHVIYTYILLTRDLQMVRLRKSTKTPYQACATYNGNASGCKKDLLHASTAVVKVTSSTTTKEPKDASAHQRQKNTDQVTSPAIYLGQHQSSMFKPTASNPASLCVSQGFCSTNSSGKAGADNA